MLWPLILLLIIFGVMREVGSNKKHWFNSTATGITLAIIVGFFMVLGLFTILVSH